jgi:hypothetical protein
LTTSVNINFSGFATTTSVVTTILAKDTDTDDRFIQKSSSSYTTAHNSGTGTVRDYQYYQIGQTFGSSTYNVFRGYTYFDTSSIPSYAVIDSANLTFVLKADESDTDFDIVVQNGQPSYPSKPAVSSDFNYTYYSGNGGSFNTVGLPALDNSFVLTLNATGRGWITKGGTTKFALRSNRDINSVAPSGMEDVMIWSFDKGTYIPKLTVRYHYGVVNLTFSSNSSGSWKTYATASTGVNGTVTTPSNSNFSTGGTKYWWKANVSSGFSSNKSVYHFTTASTTKTWHVVNSSINGSFRNVTSYHGIDSAINGFFL